MSEINNNISFRAENAEAKSTATVEAGRPSEPLVQSTEALRARQVINLEFDDNRLGFDSENANETFAGENDDEWLTVQTVDTPFIAQLPADLSSIFPI